jgi:ATP-dependent Lon protease
MRATLWGVMALGMAVLWAGPDADKTGTGLGIPVLVALCGCLLGRNTRGGTIVAGALNLGGSIEIIPNAVRIAELAIDKQAQTPRVRSS